MGAIAGINQEGMEAEVNRMLDKLVHRGLAGRRVIETKGATLGVVWTKAQAGFVDKMEENGVVLDYVADGHLAHAQFSNGTIELTRDQLGIAPLYYGRNRDGDVCFASEVKALLEHTREIHELPPGHRYSGGKLIQYYQLKKKRTLTEDSSLVAKELRRLLELSVREFTQKVETVGSWLSGGLDSSSLAALACPYAPRLHTFAVGLPGAKDLDFAAEVAEFINSDHHEIIVNFEELLAVLPDVIYHLESFDALLVRSSLTNYLVAQEAAKFVPAVLSGEGGDELFAGYAYLKSLNKDVLANELVDITSRLHNTALQRVDRSASAHSTIAHVGFLNPKVVEYAFRIPTNYKLNGGIEKWVLRKAMLGALPKNVLLRTKSKFWQGAGVGDLLARYAEKQISDSEFARERILPNGWQLNSKEELLYYRIFHESFGPIFNLAWMGRTKAIPKK
ncbi:MAG: asparagine synthase-related protein [Promethearchaeota archaeon]